MSSHSEYIISAKWPKIPESESISRVLYLFIQVAVIYLGGLLPAPTSGLPESWERAIPPRSSYLTISPLPVPGWAIGGVVSVPLSAGHPAWPFASTLPCGARTFLTGYKSRRDHPTHSPVALYPISAQE